MNTINWKKVRLDNGKFEIHSDCGRFVIRNEVFYVCGRRYNSHKLRFDGKKLVNIGKQGELMRDAQEIADSIAAHGEGRLIDLNGEFGFRPATAK